MINIILLSGGSGSRLWPLSNEARSKQFLKVLRDGSGKPQSMVQRTFEMIGNTGLDVNIVIATCASQEASIKDQVRGEYATVIEPERRDTAPAIMLSSAYLALSQGANEDDTVVVMPIDTFADQDYYNRLLDIDRVVQSGVSDLVLLGAKPTYPSNKYGYIVSEAGSLVRKVTKFVEKPSEKEAALLLEQGAFWNCGVFGYKLGYLLEIIKKYSDMTSFEWMRDNYAILPKISFDYEVVEKAESISVVPYEGTWKDLGTWNTLSEEMADDCAGRVARDEACENTHVINETGLPMVVSGIKDAVVVATPDGILVSDKSASANIKPLVAKIAETRPMHESRQWGEYVVLGQEVYETGACSLEKMLVVKAGKQLSYQRHSRRCEVWTVADGFGEVVLDGNVSPVSPGSVVVIPSGKKHAVRALSDLHIVEVQLGTGLIEEDIERFGFFWSDLNEIELKLIGGNE